MTGYFPLIVNANTKFICAIILVNIFSAQMNKDNRIIEDGGWAV